MRTRDPVGRVRACLGEHHDHLVCSCCGVKIEFSYPAIDVLQEAVATRVRARTPSPQLIGSARSAEKERR